MVLNYEDLPTFDGTSDKHAWELDSSDRGTLNRITDQVRQAAAREVRLGRSFALGLPLNHAVTTLSPDRNPPLHVELVDRGGSDDKLDNFYPQGASHWDGLRHIRYGRHGFYGGLQQDHLENGRLGIDRLAPEGIFTRGVLADVAAMRKRSGTPLDPTSRDLITTEDIENALESQGSQLRSGDILIIRTGWLGWYEGLSAAQKHHLQGSLTAGGLNSPGVSPDTKMAQWFWDSGLAAVAADNPAVEALPIEKEEGFLHRRMLALLGMPFGELWAVDELAEFCAAHGRYEFLLVSVPLLLPKGSGSPANAIAVF
ncbi:cyclase family protein [Pseudarthrobacter sp. AG30]|uniref:cyclase family protein n=1 Tax=Pseudarthrobacter sp. AG30 TaxID=2249742 RepID=UPI0014031F06|nr:cyclase family protein [Pseudarthrobacter sp. AG30]